MIFRALFAILIAGFSAAASPFSALYFFGDSLTDTGNVYKATSALNRWTFGLVPKEPAAPYVGGRFSNGPVWAEEVAARLGHPGDARPAGMSMGTFGQVGGTGNNYAVGGARTDYGGALGLLDLAIPTGIAEQVDFYLGRTSGIADPSALYFIFGGGNDLRDAAGIADAQQRDAAAIQAGENLAYSVRDLYLAGARQFVVIDSPDVGLTPELLSDGLSAQGTDASVGFNSWMSLYADYLRSVPGFSLTYFDLFGLHHELIDQYGLGSVRACKGGLASECSETLFFDSIHPTSWVHQIIGDRIADQILGSSPSGILSATASGVQTPEPSTAVLVLSAAGILFFTRWRPLTR
jgi:phospholipase/lecithinase/hemolysin